MVQFQVREYKKKTKALCAEGAPGIRRTLDTFVAWQRLR